MPLENCQRCGKVFNTLHRMVCPECLRREEDDLVRVQKHVKANTDQTLSEVAEECAVEFWMIEKWIREKRLVISARSAAALSCRNCGTKILSGNLCDSCQREFQEVDTDPERAKAPEANPFRRSVSSGSAIKDKFRR